MSSPTGSFSVGPDNATLTVRTGTAGKMAKAGHSLEIRVGTWSAQLVLGDGASLSLTADSGTLTVIDGTGGPKALSDGDREKIAGIINDKILKRSEIAFQSSSVEPSGDGSYAVAGTLTLVGASGPASFALKVGDDGSFSAATELVQTAFGIDPYSTMMGALKVKDELVIDVTGTLA